MAVNGVLYVITENPCKLWADRARSSMVSRWTRREQAHDQRRLRLRSRLTD